MIPCIKILFLVLALIWATAESTKKENTETDCPKKETSKTENPKTETPKTPKCGTNEVYNSCGSACPATCKTRFRGPEVCLDVCVPGCICVDGYFKHDNGTCVSILDCSPPTCNDDEVYTQCGTACQKNCDNNDNTCLACTKQCVEGCFCKSGTIRETADSLKCIKPDSCPAKQCSGDNEVWDRCPPTCPPQVCAAIWSRYNCPLEPSCCTPTCRCKDGYYRNDAKVCISTQICIDTKGAVDKKCQ